MRGVHTYLEVGPRAHAEAHWAKCGVWGVTQRPHVFSGDSLLSHYPHGFHFNPIRNHYFKQEFGNKFGLNFISSKVMAQSKLFALSNNQ